jgi:hypothetical protein
MRWIAGCLIVIVCLCCVTTSGVSAWLWRQYTAYPTDPTALTQIVEKQVAPMRNLEFKQPVVPQILTPDKLHEYLQKQFEQEWSPEKARGQALTLAAFDLLDPDTDLYQLYLDLYSEQVGGLYDPETRELYVVSDASSVNVLGRTTLAHELTHALQDQNYDLQKIGYGKKNEKEHDSEYMAGLEALVEGDASLLQTQYMRTFSPLDWARFGWEYSRLDMTKYNKAPRAISAGLTFPYVYGQNFVKSLYTSGGWAAVNAAYSHPPQSTEQILHPQRYLSGDAPIVVTLPPLTDTLGSGWRLVDEDILGEFYARLHLEQHLEPITATLAAEGWGGDRYATFYNDAQKTTMLAWYTVWDNTAEAAEFVDDYELYLTIAFNHDADSSQSGRSCWQKAQDYRCLTWSAKTAIIVRGPDADTVERVLGALKARP